MTHRIRLPAKIDNLYEFMDAVTSFAEQQGFSKLQTEKIALSLEEVIVNICHYAYPGNPEGEIEVTWNMDDDDSLIIKITDNGVHFDVEAKADPDTTLDIAERNVGGLGIFFVKKMMDRISYIRKDDRNILTLMIKKQADI